MAAFETDAAEKCLTEPEHAIYYRRKMIASGMDFACGTLSGRISWDHTTVLGLSGGPGDSPKSLERFPEFTKKKYCNLFLWVRCVVCQEMGLKKKENRRDDYENALLSCSYSRS